MSHPPHDFAHLASKVLSEAKHSVISYDHYYPQLRLLARGIRLTTLRLSSSGALRHVPFSSDLRILCLCVLTFALFIFLALSRGRARPLKCTSSRDSRLPFLTAFVVPTQSSKQDARLVSFTQDGIVVDVADLLEGIASGSLELRDPVDLQAIFRNQLVVKDKCKISLRVGSGLKMRTMKWALSSYADARKMENKGIGSKPQGEQTLFLDDVPQPDIEDTVSKFTTSLPFGTRARIVFTVRNPRIRFMSESHLFCAIPFISAGKSATPLSISLDQIVSCLNRVPGLRIVTATNAADRHAISLYELEWSLVENKDLRTRFTERRGE
ncbi:hypothetical protein PQX77_009773, partial [Marasmius sp. AFHP31]